MTDAGADRAADPAAGRVGSDVDDPQTRAVVFDMDGVLIDSEQVWDEVRRQYAADNGGSWTDSATRDMQGMSAPEWSHYLADAVGIDQAPEQINQGVLTAMVERYQDNVPLLPGAPEAVRRLAEHWPLGLASSSNRPLIDQVLATAGLTDCFRITLSTEQVSAGKPDPDVYLTACRLMGIAPMQAVAIEDSTSGLRAARAAGMGVVAIPNQAYPPDPDILSECSDVILTVISELSAHTIERLTERRSR